MVGRVPYHRATRPHRGTHEGPFSVELAVPRAWKSTTVANTVKPLLDGLISALHTHDGSSGIELKPRLETLGKPDTVWSMLCNPDCNLLGQRPLIRRHGDGLIWNPADERCHAFAVQRDADTAATITAVIRTTPA